MHGFSFLVSLKLTPFSRFIYIAISLIFSPFRRTASRENAAVRHFGNGGREEEREETAKCISVQAFFLCWFLRLRSDDSWIHWCVHSRSLRSSFLYLLRETHQHHRSCLPLPPRSFSQSRQGHIYIFIIIYPKLLSC